jgi:uncharacterized Zn-binding protein involved in type VI secretion
MVTLTGATSMGSIVQCAALTAKLNGKPIATVGDVATYPQASDVLVEGVPGILLNGKPIVCSGGKTAMGACVMPNTCVKVSTPETYVGFAVVPLVDTKVTWEGAQNKKVGNTTDNKEAMQEQTGGEQQNETIESSQNDEPEESENVTFESDFAPNELTDFAKARGKVLFMISMNRIFGFDGTAKAIEKLYDEAYKKPIKNPEFVVCKNKIQGKLDAAYSSETHKIYINEQFLREAVNDNYKRHELMIAIVEEYGHHLDYLIRYVYDNNENKDAEGDEGARFAYHGLYEIFNIDVIDAKETPFGTATIDGTQIEFKWEYADVYEALQRCTAHRLEGTDDHYGEFEGFDVTGKKKEKDKDGIYQEGTGANHEKIQQDAFNDVIVKKRELVYERGSYKENGISKTVFDNYTKYSDYFYRGNWMRDMSQVFAPIAIRFFAEVGLATEKSGNRYIKVVGNPDQAYSILTDVVRIMALLHFKDDYRIKQIIDDEKVKVRTGQVKTTLQELQKADDQWDQAVSEASSIFSKVATSFWSEYRKTGSLSQAASSGKNQALNTASSSANAALGSVYTLSGVVKKFIKGISVLINDSSTAFKEFRKTMDENFNWRETFVDGEESGLIPGLGQALGVSVTHDHCDNPKGLTKYSSSLKIYKGKQGENPEAVEKTVEEKIDQYYGNKGFLSRDVADNGTEVKVDRTNGIKHHLKSTEAGSSFAVRKTVVESVAERLSVGYPYNLTKKDAVVIGGALHTLQDFYAHSNYCEVYLSKYFKSVITWTGADYKNVNNCLVNNSEVVFNNVGYDDEKGALRINGKLTNVSDSDNDYIRTKAVKGQSGNKRIYKKPFYAPITSGTCDMEDLLVCGMHLVDAKLDTIFFDLEEEIQRRREGKDEEIKPHQLTPCDIAVFALLEIQKEISEGNDGIYEKAAKVYYGYILLRETIAQVKKEMKEQVTDRVKKVLKETLLPDLYKMIDDKIKAVKNMLKDMTTYLYAIAVKLILLILLNILEEYGFGKITESTLNILKLMEMKDDPSKASFARINQILSDEQRNLEDQKNLEEQANQKKPEGQKKQETAKNAYEGFYHSPLGRLYNGEDPSHTVLAKDSEVHPINEIAGQLATATSVAVLLDHMRGRYLNKEKGKEKLGKYVAHPLLSNIYSKEIRIWAYDHPQNVIKASLTVCVLERMSMKFRHVMVYKNRIHTIDQSKKQDLIYWQANRILNYVMRGIEQVDLNKLGADLNDKLDKFPDIFEAYFKSMYFELDARSFIQFTEDYERLEEQFSNKVFVPRGDKEKKILMDKWKTALKKNVQDFLIRLKNTKDDEEVQLRIPLLADLDAAPKVKPWVNFAGNLAQPRRDIVSEYSLSLINKVAEKNQVRITIESTIRSISRQASVMYTNLSNGRRISYTKPGQAVTAVYDEYTKKGASKKDTLAAMERKIAEYEKQGQRVSLHCVSEETYAKLNVIDLSLNAKSDKMKAVIQDLLNSGVSRIIQKHFPNVKEFSYKPTQKLTYMKNEPCIHVEIKQ